MVRKCIQLSPPCRILSQSLGGKEAFEVISCFLAAPSNPPVIHSLIGFDNRTAKTLVTELNQVAPACSVPTFTHEDLYKVLAGPTVEILDRYDNHSVLQFLLMKLRTALDLTWVNNLPELRKVRFQCFHANICLLFHFRLYSRFTVVQALVSSLFYTAVGKPHNTA